NHVNRLTGTQALRILGNGFDAVDQPGALLCAENYGWGEGCLAGDKTDTGIEWLAAVTCYVNHLVEGKIGDCRFRNEEANADILRRQERNNRTCYRNNFAGTVIYGLDGAIGGCNYRAFG